MLENLEMRQNMEIGKYFYDNRKLKNNPHLKKIDLFPRLPSDNFETSHRIEKLSFVLSIWKLGIQSHLVICRVLLVFVNFTAKY
jgi:hypothetical protein